MKYFSVGNLEYLVSNVASLLPENYREIKPQWGLATSEIFLLENYDNPVVLVAPENDQDSEDWPLGIFELDGDVEKIDWIGFNNWSSYSGTFLFDANDDGLSDLFVPGQSGHNPTGSQGEIPFLALNSKSGFEDISGDVFTEPSYTHGWTFGDFDGNGFTDIVLNSLKYDELPLSTIMMSQGDGTFVSRRDLLPAEIAGDKAMPPSGPQLPNYMSLAIRSGDMDNDGDLDLIVPEYKTNGWEEDKGFFLKKLNPQIWINDGSGKFSFSEKILPLYDQTASTYFANDLEVVDINKDGKLEVIYAVDTGDIGVNENYLSDHLVILQETDAEGYQNVAKKLVGNDKLKVDGYWPIDISYNDLNVDGYEDIVVSLSPWGGVDAKDPAVVIYYNNGNGYYSPELVSVSTQWAVNFKLFDDDGDGVRDAYMFNRGNTVDGEGSYVRYSGKLINQVKDRSGTDGDDILVGFGDGGVLSPGLGNDLLVGGNGVDVASFAIASNQVSLLKSSSGLSDHDWKIKTEVENNTLISVERISFKDKKIALDLEGSAGITAKVLGAFLGEAGVSQPDLVGIGLGLVDNGLTYEGFLEQAIVAIFGPDPSGADMVKHFYQSLTGQAAPEALVNQYAGLIDGGSLAPVDLAMQVAESELNIQNVGLIGLTQTGLDYI